MSRWTVHARVGYAAVLAVLVVGAAACGGDGDPAGGDGATSAATASATATASGADAAGQPFGPGCAGLPADAADPASPQAMAGEPLAAAVQANPSLSTLSGAIDAVPGLAEQLDAAVDLTFFAPTDAAFQKLEPKTYEGLLADPTSLSNVLSFHVVGEPLTKANVAGTFPTLAGQDQTLTIQGDDTGFTINGNARVVCGNLSTSNATLYLIDTVLMPA